MQQHTDSFLCVSTPPRYQVHKNSTELLVYNIIITEKYKDVHMECASSTVRLDALTSVWYVSVVLM